MSWIRRKWTAVDADEWTREDYLAMLISPVAYMMLMVGVALAFLLRPIGFVILAVAALLTFVMHWIIDPKLKAVSEEYERKQRDYLHELEAATRWEDTDSKPTEEE